MDELEAAALGRLKLLAGSLAGQFEDFGIEVDGDGGVLAVALDPIDADDGGAAEVFADLVGGGARAVDSASAIFPHLLNQVALGLRLLHGAFVQLVLVAGGRSAPAGFALAHTGAVLSAAMVARLTLLGHGLRSVAERGRGSGMLRPLRGAG